MIRTLYIVEVRIHPGKDTSVTPCTNVFTHSFAPKGKFRAVSSETGMFFLESEKT